LSLEIVKGIDNFPKTERQVVATIGTFDGLHLGHQEILRCLMKSAEEKNLDPIAITFEPHPRVLVTPNDPPPLLTTWEEKVKYFSQYMTGRLLILEFNRDLMALTAEDFVRDYLTAKLNLKKLIVGYDHAFGKNRSGTINDLMGLSGIYKFELEVVNPIIREGRPISSTRIRKLILSHQFNHALEMLGHPYPVSGQVIRGIGLGKKLGYPTANIDFHERKLLPVEGVYSCQTEIDGKMYRGMMFIGNNHFNPERNKSVEVNVFDFDRDIYGETVYCYPEIFIRENKVFNDTEDLVAQIDRDKKEVLRIFNKGETR